MRDAAPSPASRDLSRLLRPRSVALFGGGWAENVAEQLLKAGFEGEIWPVSPSRAHVRGIPCFRSVDDLPAPPDAAFIGVNRSAAIEVTAALAARGGGGAICFASGFAESGGEDLQRRLVEAAGEMPLLGPNCYGLINALDGVALWPDQHGARRVERGVAIVSQSSNIAISLTMQRRGLPISHVIAAGNQAQTGLAEIASALLDDPRVTALGLYIESFGDIRAFEAMAAKAQALGKPVAALKAGRSEAAREGALSHTASLAGGAAVSSAFLRRLGVIETASPAVFLEALKLLHAGGPLTGGAVASMSCSGGEACLMADLAEGTAIGFRAPSTAARAKLSAALGPLVAIANPLDYHTFIWGDSGRMAEVFGAVMADGHDLTALVLDFPRADICDPASFACAEEAIIAAAKVTGGRAVVIASLPENLDEAACERLLAAGIAPLNGLADGMAAIDALIRAGGPVADPPAALTAAPAGATRTLTEAEAKAALSANGVPIPRGVTARTPAALARAAETLRYPLALKVLGIAHKTEAGGVALNLADAAALEAAADAMPPPPAGFLAEEMAQGAVAELLVGVTVDASGLTAMTLASGGVLAELLDDSATLILPATEAEIRSALLSLKIAAVLKGHRGRPAADIDAIVAAAAAIARFAEAQGGRLEELDVNPLIALPQGAVAVDALIRLKD